MINIFDNYFRQYSQEILQKMKIQLIEINNLFIFLVLLIQQYQNQRFLKMTFVFIDVIVTKTDTEC